MYCSYCGKQIADGKKFCQYCGHPLRYCDGCGSLIADGSPFCQSCGRALTPLPEAAPVPTRIQVPNEPEPLPEAEPAAQTGDAAEHTSCFWLAKAAVVAALIAFLFPLMHISTALGSGSQTGYTGFAFAKACVEELFSGESDDDGDAEEWYSGADVNDTVMSIAFPAVLLFLVITLLLPKGMGISGSAALLAGVVSFFTMQKDMHYLSDTYSILDIGFDFGMYTILLCCAAAMILGFADDKLSGNYAGE